MAALPSGAVLLWSGAIVDIPGGFVLCDGNNGTPDLRDRFVVGAGDTYNPDDSGGALTHVHTFTGDGHFHDIPTNASVLAGEWFADNTGPKSAVGTTDNASSLPEYYALAYIMKT